MSSIEEKGREIEERKRREKRGRGERKMRRNSAVFMSETMNPMFVSSKDEIVSWVCCGEKRK